MANLTWTDAAARAALRGIFDAAVAAADPRVVLARHLPDRPKSGRVVVVGAGKAAAVMAAALEDAWPDMALSGVVVTRYEHAVPTRHIEVLQASHPRPDANSAASATKILAAVHGLTKDDLVIALISGGGSALMALPAPGLELADKIAVNRVLLECGATIGEMNVIRKHLSGIKGGRLAAAAAPARLVTLAISDVPGDSPAVIASGPTVPDASLFADARAIVARYRMKLPPAAMARLAQDHDETPKPGSLPPADYRLIATPAMALDAAAAAARAMGIEPMILGDALEGESRDMGIIMAGMATFIEKNGFPAKPPAVMLSGGETTVTLDPAKPTTQGGRNTEFLLALAVQLKGQRGVWALAGDTDGIDGNQDAAGALVGPDTLARAEKAGLNPRALLDAHDSYQLFNGIGDLIRTGPTLTNVNDIRAILIVPREPK